MTTLQLLVILFGFVLISPAFLNAVAQSDDKKQFFIKDQIKKLDATDQYKKDPDYQKYYTPWKLVDNLTNTVSYWSGNGESTVKFQTDPLKYPLCSIIVGVKEPELLNHYSVKVSNTTGFKNANGILDQANTQIDIKGCVTNVNSIDFAFKPADPKEWTILSEMSFITNKDVDQPPPIDPPDCKPNEHLEGNQCVPNQQPNNNTAVITNSNITLTVSNSTIKINADQSSNVINNESLKPKELPPTETLTDAKITDMQPAQPIPELKHDPNDKSDEIEEQKEKQDQKDNNDDENNGDE